MDGTKQTEIHDVTSRNPAKLQGKERCTGVRHFLHHLVPCKGRRQTFSIGSRPSQSIDKIHWNTGLSNPVSENSPERSDWIHYAYLWRVRTQAKIGPHLTDLSVFMSSDKNVFSNESLFYFLFTDGKHGVNYHKKFFYINML